jgi:hypothetical protein
MKLSDAQHRAVEILTGEEGWVRRGTIQQKTMDVLIRLDLVETKRDTAIHVTVYRATQNARDWLRAQQDDALPKTSVPDAMVTAEDDEVEGLVSGDVYEWPTATPVTEEQDSPYAAAVAKYMIRHCGYAVADAMATVRRYADMVDRGDRFGSNIDYIAWEVSGADYQASKEAHEAPIDALVPTADDVAAMAAPAAWFEGLAAPEVHEACGIKVADHCAYCDTCPRGAEKCGCPVEDGVLPVHGDCGKPMADHCAACDECPRTPGPCWCVATVADDEPVVIVPAGQGPRYAINFGPATVADVVTFSPVADILATLATVPDAPPEYRVTGHGDRPYHLIGVDGDVATVRPVNGGMEWAHDACDVYRVGSSVSIAAPRWTARHGKVKLNRRNRKG